METRNNIRQHCPEVEKLMGGKMPIITRYGITLVVVIIIVIVVSLLVLGEWLVVLQAYYLISCQAILSGHFLAY